MFDGEIQHDPECKQYVKFTKQIFVHQHEWTVINTHSFSVSTLILGLCETSAHVILPQNIDHWTVRKLILRPEIVRNVFILVWMQPISLFGVALGVKRNIMKELLTFCDKLHLNVK